MKKKNKLKILLVGPLPPPVVGTTVSFQQLTKALKPKKYLEIITIDTSRKSSDFSFLDTITVAIKSFCKLIYYIKKVDIITFHASSNATLLFGQIIHVMSRLYGKPWILRAFGGNIDQYYQYHSRWMKIILNKTVFSANLCLFQTHHLVKFFKGICKHRALWYSNNRPMDKRFLSKAFSDQCRKFVYVGNVKYSKGIAEIIAAGEQLDKIAIVDIFGPFQEGMKEQDFKGLKIVRYRGILPHDKVIPTLQSYDALLLPTYYKGEGYPGVILEAYAVGITVIASRWRAIPEIVDETTGILIEPRDAEALLSAMKKLMFNPEFYRFLRQEVLKKRDLFSATKWTGEFIQYCKILANKSQL